MNLSILTTQAARRHGARIAIEEGTRQWSYAEFDDLVDRLASGLAHRFPVGGRVGVMMSNRAEAIMLQFALERASLVRVPVNARYTAHDLKNLMRDCDAACVIFDDACEPAVRGADLPESIDTVSVEAGNPVWAALISHAVDPAALHLATPTTLATINYTSGTTGAPKGVMLSHANWMAVYRNMLVDRDMREDDIVAYVGPLTHSSGAYLAPWFWRGARNIIVDPPNGARLLDLIEARGVTAFTCVPTFLTKLLALPDIGTRKLQSLRLIGYGAEPIPANTLEKAWRLFGPILWQNYGQTEAMMTCMHLPPSDHVARDASGNLSLVHGLLGRPYTFVEAVLRDETGHPAAVGTMGELTIRADHVMQGYWQNPEATASALREGWLWTGDLAIADASGLYRLVGRRKDMLICGGFNIYPGEVEAQLTRIDGVSEAAVVARSDPEWGEIAVAFVTLLPGSAHDARSLASVSRPLLGIKSPKAWHVLQDMPKNNNGKINKRALIARDQAAIQGAIV